MIGVQCSGGRIADMRLLPVAISSIQKPCPETKPALCGAGLYTYYNGGEYTVLGLIRSAADSAVKVVVNVVKAVGDGITATANAIVKAVTPVIDAVKAVFCFGIFC